MVESLHPTKIQARNRIPLTNNIENKHVPPPSVPLPRVRMLAISASAKFSTHALLVSPHQDLGQRHPLFGSTTSDRMS